MHRIMLPIILKLSRNNQHTTRIIQAITISPSKKSRQNRSLQRNHCNRLSVWHVIGLLHSKIVIWVQKIILRRGKRCLSSNSRRRNYNSTGLGSLRYWPRWGKKIIHSLTRRGTVRPLMRSMVETEQPQTLTSEVLVPRSLINSSILITLVLWLEFMRMGSTPRRSFTVITSYLIALRVPWPLPIPRQAITE